MQETVSSLQPDGADFVWRLRGVWDPRRLTQDSLLHAAVGPNKFGPYVALTCAINIPI